jgi:hypothetical protein
MFLLITYITQFIKNKHLLQNLRVNYFKHFINSKFQAHLNL